MKRPVAYLLTALIVLLMGFYSCELDKIDPCPCITTINPSTARSGETITLNGEFINYNASRDRITIDGMEVQPEDVFGNDIQVKLPTGIDDSKVTVVVNINGCNSNALTTCVSSFDYKKVEVTSINPIMGRMGDTLTIFGSNFRTQDPVENTVMFGNVVADNVFLANDDRLVLIIPKGAETGNVSVTVDGFEVPAGDFTYFYSAVSGQTVMGASCLAPNFLRPVGIATDSEGNVFVADEEAHQIFKISAATGVKEFFAGDITGLPGSNPIETDLSSSKFNRPWDISLDKDEIKYIADFANGQLRKIETDRVATIIDGISPPYSIAVNQDKDVFFSDITNTIKTLPQGSTTVENYANGFNNPTGIFMAENGDLYVADTQNHKIKYVEASTGNVIDVAGDGNGMFGDGTVDIASFNRPRDLLIDDRDNIFVADSGNNRIRVITPTGLVYTLFGNGNSNCANGLDEPWGIAVYQTLQQLTLYVADTENSVIKKIIYE